MANISAAFSTEIEAERTSPLESDYYMSFLNKEIVGREHMLYKSKWFDYRHMTPLQATGAYVDAFLKVYKRIYAREFDARRAPYVRPLNFENLLVGMVEGDLEKRKLMTGCWKGRQVADFLTMPYEVYVDLAFSFRMRHWKRNFMPRPFHLYRMLDVEKIADRWEELQASKLYYAEHSAYLVQNYQGLMQQDDYHEWLFKQAAKRQRPQYYIAQFINEDRLPYQKVEARVSADDWELIKRDLR